MRFLNKKGISPLIATVLLIGFTVALAGIVITWGSNFVKNITSGTEERTESTLACAGDLNFEITRYTCGDYTNLVKSTVTIDNKGNTVLEKVAIRFFNNQDELLNPTNEISKKIVGPVGAFEIKTFNLLADNEDNMLESMPDGTVKIEAIATISVNGQEVTCGDAGRKKEQYPACIRNVN